MSAVRCLFCVYELIMKTNHNWPLRGICFGRDGGASPRVHRTPDAPGGHVCVRRSHARWPRAQKRRGTIARFENPEKYCFEFRQVGTLATCSAPRRCNSKSINEHGCFLPAPPLEIAVGTRGLPRRALHLILRQLRYALYKYDTSFWYLFFIALGASTIDMP